MKAAYVKSPYQFEVRDEKLREITEDEIVVKVKACGVCGTDITTAASEAKEFQPFGHEIAGVVYRAGKGVRNVKEGDQIVLESGTFCRYCANCRNGRSDLCNDGPNFWLKGPMGFSEYLIAPKEMAVKFSGMSFAEAALIEPLGVALDVTYTADIKLNNDVLVVGLGPIGLMALRLVRQMGARNVYGASLSRSTRRIELARDFGATDVIFTDKQSLSSYSFPRGGVDRVIMTAPPRMIPEALKVMTRGGIMAFIGIEYGAGAMISFDANEFHFNKYQLRASHAAPALYFPTCIELVNSGVVDMKSMISHTFTIDRIAEAFTSFPKDKEHLVKAVMVDKGE
ncbi:MAG TPA: alcohol dehydrogenase catalytic domain-containing protein [Spirochaetia bacterium]|jgi:L-iditol 2-dehydrogenase|nr:alcohol dehydrogenase catalytic domain-containing protein [Spirochaetia bacterium]